MPVPKPEDHNPETAKPPLKEMSLIEMGFDANVSNGWEDIVQPPKVKLYKLLKEMICKRVKPNVQIRVGTATFNCHMIVLQCYSEYFLGFTDATIIQLPEKKVTPSAFAMVYDWMLADKPLVSRDGILELFIAANFLRIKHLINQCWMCLDDDQFFREDSAFMLYLEARSYGLENLQELMFTRISKFFLTIVASQEFLVLNPREIRTLLTSNMIAVNTEIEIFMSAVRWLCHDWENRERDMLDVIRCVRFNLMPPCFLITLNKSTNGEEIDRITCHPEVMNMINDGISFTTMQLFYGGRREDFLHFIEQSDLVSPMQREWVMDKDCTYHYGCPNLEYITYPRFLSYLEKIQAVGKTHWQSLEMAKSTAGSVCDS